LSLLAVSLGVGQSLLTINERTYGPAIVRTLVGATVNISLNFVLLPRYGAVGAAAATVVSYVLAAVLLNGLTPTTRHVLRWQLGSLDPRSTVPVLSSEARRLRPGTRSAK
jgi:PST family polysaccharide transporter